MESFNVYRPVSPEEEIVISGIAGRFPGSKNLEELKDNLMNKKDLTTSEHQRWFLDHADLPRCLGVIHDLEKFDAKFFDVPQEYTLMMDPLARMLMEHTYEAIIDAGVNPAELRGTNTAVIVGTCYTEAFDFWVYDETKGTEFASVGCSKSMYANRISKWLGLNGPSYTLDTACSSSLYALDHAYRLMRDGLCDAALVGGVNVCMHPFITMQFHRLGVLSTDGKCKSFDANANGYVRSETISTIFLQKAKNARRIYATVIYTKTNCDGYKPQGITYPSSALQEQLLQEFYKDCELSPTILSYLEAHCTGTKVGDPEELTAIDRAICKGRQKPLKIGGVKSNLGHAEPASGLCSIAKVIIAMETGVIPPNINLKQIRNDLEILKEKRVQVIVEPTPWECGYTGINSFGFGGANAHVLLKPNSKEKIKVGEYSDDLPKLVVASGTTEDAVSTLLNSVVNMSLDVEYIRLLHEVYAKNITKHFYRGFIIAKREKSQTPVRVAENTSDSKRPILFVFSALGSQWPGMGSSMMKFPVFARTIQKCDAVLKRLHIDIVDIITSKNKSSFDNILKSVLGITVVQVTDKWIAVYTL